jgi:Peptidase family S41/PDZ domain
VFYDICVRYVASLRDSHDEFVLPSYYEAFLPITADIYDGKVLIDSIDRSALDPQTYPFVEGDELVSVNGKSVAHWITELAPYAVNGEANPVSRNRLAVGTMLDRYQGWYTFAKKIQPGDTATIVVKSNGKTASYSLTWETFGLPLNHEGPVPNRGAAMMARSAFSQSIVKHPMRELAKANKNPWGVWMGARPARQTPALSNALKKMRRHQVSSNLQPAHVVAGGISPFGSFFPAFNPPPGFTLRLGADPADEFVSGTFISGNRTIGFIRIPSFEPNSEGNALAQFQSETTFFQHNTSGLVIDLMANGGGSICYANYPAQYVSPKPFNSLGFKLRATEEWVLDTESLLLDQEFGGAPESDIDLVAGYLNEIQQALAEKRGLTKPIPIGAPVFCNGVGGVKYPPATDESGSNIAYTKPILLLTDNFTLSAAELFSATLQDDKRATVYGVGTDGGGGNVIEFDFNAGPYAEGTARMTQSLAVRNDNVSAQGFPSLRILKTSGCSLTW